MTRTINYGSNIVGQLQDGHGGLPLERDLGGDVRRRLPQVAEPHRDLNDHARHLPMIYSIFGEFGRFVWQATQDSDAAWHRRRLVGHILAEEDRREGAIIAVVLMQEVLAIADCAHNIAVIPEQMADRSRFVRALEVGRQLCSLWVNSLAIPFRVYRR